MAVVEAREGSGLRLQNALPQLLTFLEHMIRGFAFVEWRLDVSYPNLYDW